MLQVIGGNEARSDMTTKRLTELDQRDHQLEQRMAELEHVQEVVRARRATLGALTMNQDASTSVRRYSAACATSATP